jgi:hypothetical protein
MARKTEDGMVQTTMWLPRKLHQHLKQISEAGGLGEELRHRLEKSVEAEKTSAPETQELLAAIARAADETAAYYGDCVKDAFSFEVLKLCIDLLLKTYQPEGEVRPNPDLVDAVAEVFFAPDHSPKDISRIIVGDLIRARAKRADEGKR